MKKLGRIQKIILSILLALMTNQSLAKSGGSGTGGGDRLTKLFSRALTDSWKVVAFEISYQYLDDEISARVGVKSVREWYKENAWNLATDLYNLKLVWREKNPNGKCGETAIVNIPDHAKPPLVYQAFRDCDNYTYADAVEHLIGESLHHFGFTNSQVAAFASGIRAAWEKKSKSTNIPASWIGYYAAIGFPWKLAIDKEMNVWLVDFNGRSNLAHLPDWTNVGRLSLKGESLTFKPNFHCKNGQNLEVKISLDNLETIEHGMYGSSFIMSINQPKWPRSYCDGESDARYTEQIRFNWFDEI